MNGFQYSRLGGRKSKKYPIATWFSDVDSSAIDVGSDLMIERIRQSSKNMHKSSAELLCLE